MSERHDIGKPQTERQSLAVAGARHDELRYRHEEIVSCVRWATSEGFDAFAGPAAAMSTLGRSRGVRWRWAKPLSFIPLDKQCLTFLAAYHLSAVNGIS
jgi:hypothetical protein